MGKRKRQIDAVGTRKSDPHDASGDTSKINSPGPSNENRTGISGRRRTNHPDRCRTIDMQSSDTSSAFGQGRGSRVQHDMSFRQCSADSHCRKQRSRGHRSVRFNRNNLHHSIGTRNEIFPTSNANKDSRTRNSHSGRGGRHFQSRGNQRNYHQRHWHNMAARGCDSQRTHGRGTSDNEATLQSNSGAETEENTNDAGNSNNDLEIPGFYYDAEKKKYFKILPGHQSANSTMLTREVIKLKKTEEARQQSLREFALKTIRMDPAYAGSTSAHKPRCHYSRNLTDQVHCVRNGVIRTHETRLFQHRVINHQLSNLQAFTKRKIFTQDDGAGTYKRLEHMTQMCAAPGDASRVLCLWSLEGLIVQRIQLLQIDQVALRATPPEGASMSLTPVGAVLLQSFSKVTHMCWAPSTPGQTTNVPVLYTTTCFIGNSPSLALMRTLEEEPRASGSDYTEFHLGQNTTWTCAWSAHKQKFSIGTKDSALVIDVATRRLWELFTKKSDVFCQTFNHADGNTLYSGTKKGVIVGHDLRSSSTRSVTALHHRSPVCHTHLLTNDVHLIAADYSGRLCMWDLRTCGVVQDYVGHNNEYVRIPFKVDASESVICGVGQDCYTRLWDVQTGRLLTSVPPPYPASRDLIPSVAVYTAPHGNIDRPGVLMGIKDELHFYSA